MRKKRRCNLCGAKLTGDICSECGYNNAACDYKVNTSDHYCSHSSTEKFYSEEDHEKHTDSWDYDQMESWTEESGEKDEGAVSQADAKDYGLNEERVPKKQRVSGKRRSGKKKKPGKWLLVILFLWLVPAGVELIVNIAERSYEEHWETVSRVFPEQEEQENEETSGTLSGGEENRAETESAVSNRTAAGGTYRAELGPGFYVAGIHIPAGQYDAKLQSGSGSCQVRNPESGYWESAYLYEDGGRSDREMEKLALEPGTLLQISDSLRLEFSTKENQGYLSAKKNSLTDGADVTDGMVAGKDFPAGTYHVKRVVQDGEEERGSLLHTYQASYGREEYEIIELDESVGSYQNLTLEEGDLLVTLNCRARLEPAEYDLSEYGSIW